MKKRLISVLLTAVMLISLIPMASAVVIVTTPTALSLSASADTLYQGAEVTLTMSLDGASAAKQMSLLFGFDADTFTAVSGEWLLSGAVVSNFDADNNSAMITYMLESDMNGDVFTLKLKAKDDAPLGEATVTVTPTIKNGTINIPCDGASVNVTVQANECTHPVKTPVAAQESSLTEQGWEAYCVCDNCHQLFAADGVTKISAIPYLPLLTPPASDAVLAISASSDTVYQGNELTFTVSLSGAAPAKSMALKFDFDANTFTVVSGEWSLSGAMLSTFDPDNNAAASNYMSEADYNGEIFTLTLKAKDDAPLGTATVSVTPSIKNGETVIPCDGASVTVTVQADVCAHSIKNSVTAKASTYTEQGWEAYYVCKNCGQLFASDGVTKISSIPYLPLLIPEPGTATLSFSASADKVHPDDEVTITVSLSDAALAKSMSLLFELDESAFTVVSGTWLLTGAIVANFDSTKNAAAIVYSSEKDMNGEVFTLTLKAKESASLGEKTVTVTSVIKNAAVEIPCVGTSAALTVAHVGGTANCSTKAVCTKCGAEYGDFDPNVHFGGTANCSTKAVCAGCGVSYGEFDPNVHFGGTATCHTKAVCTGCGTEYGEFDPNNHAGGTEIRDAAEASCIATGYTGDTYCLGCNTKIADGATVPTTDHTPGEWMIDSAAGVDVAGSKHKECTVCHTTLETEQIPAYHEMTVSTVSARAGENVTLTFTLCEVPGLKSIAFSGLTYDSAALELVGGEWKLSGGIMSNWDPEGGAGVFAFTSNTDVSGVIFELTFKVKDGTEDGMLPVSCNVAAKTKLLSGVEENIDIRPVDGGVEVVSVAKGDVNGDGDVTSDDAIYLLYHTLLPDMYPINQDGDFNGDGDVTSDDAIYLLYHTLLPDMYPLK